MSEKEKKNMKKSMKKLFVLGLASCLSVSSAIVAFADWEQDEYGDYMYRKDDGSLAYDEWLEIDGKTYYFSGECMSTLAITPEGYTLSEDGSWNQSVPQKTHEQIRRMYLASIEDDARLEYAAWLNGSEYFTSEEDVAASNRSLAEIMVQVYPALSPEDIATSQELEQMMQKIKTEDMNERGKNVIKCALLSGREHLSSLDELIRLDLEGASPEYKEQAKAEIMAEYTQALGSY